jgi:cytochrome-b5 reductase
MKEYLIGKAVRTKPKKAAPIESTSESTSEFKVPAPRIPRDTDTESDAKRAAVKPTSSPQRRKPAPKPTANAQDRTRHKVPLAPGHSAMDWMRKMQAMRLTPMRRITISELAKHDKVDDMWMAIRGRVYDVTSYVPFHPGGVDQIARGAGKNATKLFDSVHMWVNIDFMLAKCAVGVLVDDDGNPVRG